MNLETVLKNRKSCRNYLQRLIPEEYIKRILWAGSRAPYASGGSRRKVMVVKDEKGKSELQKACFNQNYVSECSAVFVVCGTDLEIKLQSGHPKYVHGCDAANMCMDLMATDLGLGTCWIGHFNIEAVKKILGCEERPTIILLVGWAK